MDSLKKYLESLIHQTRYQMRVIGFIWSLLLASSTSYAQSAGDPSLSYTGSATSYGINEIWYDPAEAQWTVENSENVSAGGNTHIEFYIRQWGNTSGVFRVELADQNSAATNTLDIPNYATVTGTFTKVTIPLSDFSTFPFTALRWVSFRTEPNKSIEVKGIRFVGGTATFVYFGAEHPNVGRAAGWVFTPAASPPPVANAGTDKKINLPANALSLIGSGTTSSGTIVSYAWDKVSGPFATLLNANTATLSLTGLVQGSYIFRLTVTNNSGITGSDYVNVTVEPPNLALNRLAVASSRENNNVFFAESKAFDGDITTRWSSLYGTTRNYTFGYSITEMEVFGTVDLIPGIPNSLGGSPSSLTSINLTWVDNSINETGFQIERWTGTSFSLITTAPVNAVSYMDIGLTSGTTYTYRIRAVNANGNSAYTPEITVITPTEGLIPDADELSVLRTIAEGSSDERLTAQGWPSISNWPSTASSAQFGSWGGISVVDNDIVEISFYGDYFGYFPEVELLQLKRLSISNSLIYGLRASLPNLEELRIGYNVFQEDVTFGGFSYLKFLGMSSYRCYPDTYDPNRTYFDGPCGDPDLSQLVQLEYYEGDGNKFTDFPSGLISLTSLKSIYLYNNYLQSVPNGLVNFSQLRSLNLGKNYLTDLPVGLADLPALQSLDVSYNRLDFGDLEQFFNGVNMLKKPGFNLVYENQGNVPPQDVIATSGKYNIINNRGGGAHTQYQWYEYMAAGWSLLAGKTSQDLVFNDMNATYVGKKYRCEMTNDWITGMTINSSEFTIQSVSNFPVIAPSGLQAVAGSSLSVKLSWVDNSTNETGFEIERSTSTGNGFGLIATTAANAVSFSDPSLVADAKYYYRIRAIIANGSSDYSAEASATAAYSIDELIVQDSLRANVIPLQVKIDRNGQIPSNTQGPPNTLNTLNNGDLKLVFPTCGSGFFYVGFQLYYGLEDKKTTKEWLSQVTVSLVHLENGQQITVWSGPLQVNTKNQTFISTSFYNQAIECDGLYRLRLDQKLNVSQAPESNITLKVLLYPVAEESFNTAATVDLNCVAGVANEIQLSGTYPSTGAKEFDLEWVFIATHENITPLSPQDAFTKHEPVRVTLPTISFTHQVFYQTGKIWYRMRAVGYSAQYPDHRILGTWSYSPCPSLNISNPQEDKNWQVQTVFAEDGKNKKVVHYFDGTLRTRQSQTNLSTEGITLSGETLYDFEGRKSTEILAAPSEVQYNSTLKFKPFLNNFQPIDALVIAKTSSVRKKFNYDNQGAENSTLSNVDGAGRYYSPANSRASEHSNFIPDAEGYVYSQTEYLNDGTGRVRRQSGVGKEFRIDGTHATKYFYGSAAPVELIRLFGTNVGNASHYKKNLVVDANGQVSVSYHDQSDRVIASALAGEKPNNVDPLPSFTNLDGTQIAVDISNKNEKANAISVTSHKLLNTSPNTAYSFRYELSALGSQIAELACQTCTFELSITITDPDGELVNLGTIADNEAPNSLSYLKKNITTASCTSRSTQIVQINLLDGSSPNGQPLVKIGDYTITKTLRAVELTFDEMKTVVQQSTSMQLKMQQLRDSYPVDPSQCTICTPPSCPDADDAINDAINKVALQDCENILRQITQDVRVTLGHEPVTPAEIQLINNDSRYCQYQLCIQNKDSDIFEKQLARIPNWSAAVTGGFINPTNTANLISPINIDPFFNNTSLSGTASKTTMLNRLNGLVPPTFKVDGITPLPINSSISTPRAIEVVVDPTSAAYFIDDNGNATNSNLVGRHILYMYLMGIKNTMTPTAYAAELDKQQWALYKSFYLEAKRKTKLGITAYTSCTKAKEELQQTDQIPTTENSVKNWSKGKILTDPLPVNDQQLLMSLYNIKRTCNPTLIDPNHPELNNISAADAELIKNYLRAYFNSDPKNFFRLILKKDLITNTNLQNINSILSRYRCGLNNVAVDDPINCVDERRIFNDNTNLVVNPDYLGCGTGPINAPVCNGWSPVSGYPSINIDTSSGAIKYYATLKGKTCDPNSDALRGTLRKPLVPGKSYIFSVTSKPTNGIANVNNYVIGQFTRSNEYNKIGEVACGDIAVRINPINSIVCCSDPEVKYPDGIGSGTHNVWDTRFQFRESGWHTWTRSFTATEASTSFVFSIKSYFQRFSDNLETWCEYGSFRNLNDPTLSNVFAGLSNSYGAIEEGVGRGDGYGLSLHLVDIPPPDPCPGPGCPDPCPGPNCPCGPTVIDCPQPIQARTQNNIASIAQANEILAKFNAVSDGNTYPSYLVTVWVKTPSSSYISTNPSSELFLALVDGGTNVIQQRNFVSLASTNDTWQKLTMQVSQLPAGGVAIGSSIFDTEVYSGGTLLIDEVFVLGVNPEVPESIDIKDVSIIEDLPAVDFTFCADYQTPAPIDYIGQYVTNCMANAALEATLLTNLAIDNLLENEVTNFSNTYRTKCMDNAKETLTYTYVPKEYHYTLYYYDQAGNLVQTVPPEGVIPLNATQLANFASNPVNLGHRLITRYQYNSLNQLLKQTTPDAGESNFWYNDKSQLKLSQNARQLIDNNYSYTKYDEQGRITEVGEMATTDPVSTLTVQLNNSTFPTTYTLTDITKTHYDFAAPMTLQWTNLSNVVVNGNSLTNTGGGYWVDHASSINSIPANVDGYLEFKIGTPTSDFEMGLSAVANSPNYTSVSYGLGFIGGSVFRMENSNASVALTTYLLSDLFHIERRGSTIVYFKNGIEFFTSTVPSTTALYANCFLNTIGSTITNISMGLLEGNSSSGDQSTFVQRNLRNRVAWVEVMDKASLAPNISYQSVYKNDGSSLNGVINIAGSGATAIQESINSESYIKVENICPGLCERAGVAFNARPMTVIPGESYLIRAKGYRLGSGPVQFELQGNGSQGLVFLTYSDKSLPLGAAAEGWIEQAVSIPSGVTSLYVTLLWKSPALGQVYYLNEIQIIKKISDSNNQLASYYSYDIHGNVKSLLQQIPGLANKRTDYVYDLVSGKVNFVMYQYAQQDQFIHRYNYDADNRIIEVSSSSDGFMWDREAEYKYYLHGPMARTKLGHYSVQGSDYYYTLQGWLKGVNSPTGVNAQANDPGQDGVIAPSNLNAMVAKDVYAYNLGYYNGDYKPNGGVSSALIETTSPLLWRGAGGEALDLYNGNIAWMATDLAKIGQVNGNRNTGVQAMQYRYDQLNRIVRSRSLGGFNESTGLAARTVAPAAYDEDYTYDANGNIKTLLRNDNLAAAMDNFNYQYYSGTNRLRGVKPITGEVTYTQAVTSNSKIYRNITVTDDAYLPDGADVTLRATENIYVHPRFKKGVGKSFRAYIDNTGPYIYDAIGNLIADQDEGATISWTPYGKVREVKTKGDSITVSYRYDAAGNRVEKRVYTLPAENIIWKDAAYVKTTPTSMRSTISGCCGGAVSEQVLPANTDGWLEFTTREIVGSKGIGFSAINKSDNSAYSIDYSFYMSQYSLYPFENGQYKGFFNFAAGDLFRIERTSGVIKYYQNGNLLYTSQVPTTTALMVDVGFDGLGASIENIRTSFTTKPAQTEVTNYVRDASGNVMSVYRINKPAPTAITWNQLTNITYQNGSLIGNSLNGQAITAPATYDGFGVGVEFTVPNTNLKTIVSLRGLIGANATPIYYYLNFDTPSVFDIRNGSGTVVFTNSYAVGDNFAIRKDGEITRVYQDDRLLFTGVADLGVISHIIGVIMNGPSQLDNFIFINGSSGVLQVEQPIYGSSRLGQYLGGRKEGQQRFGRKNYELTNHLGNVLTVITDNINMSPTDGVYATVVSATDYYPFGLEMKGRTYSNDQYRYGFNGKEKDNSFASGNNYDYGFRIYNPRIAKFLSVDPLTKEYPWYTPYQFAGNKPIWAIDLDGLEELLYSKIKNPSLIQAIDAGFVTYPLMQTANGIGNFYRKVEAQVKGEETYDRSELVIATYEYGTTELYQESTPTPARNGWQGVKDTGSDALDMANVMGGNSATGIFTKIPAKGQIAKDLIKFSDDALETIKAQWHHIFTNKNFKRGEQWSLKFEPLFKKAGYSLDDVINKVKVPGHKGPHPDDYHEAVFKRLIDATEGKKGKDYTAAFQKTLEALQKEVSTKGTELNKLVTKTN